uniref:Nudix hydrolase domain-containing protein n=1 Tax=viral metagenome TaxID=1070528 RepID=A0A6C0EAI7_9ZZZZ
MTDRKAFYYNNDKSKPVTAAGLIIYKFEEDKMKLLLIESRGQYEDIGGRVDEDDKTIIDTVVREVYEESNKLIKRKNTRKKLQDAPSVYNAKCKYVVYFIEATKRQKEMTKKDFGDKELHDNIKRTISWIDTDVVNDSKIVKYKLAWRLKYYPVLNQIKKIKEQHQIKKVFSSEDSP